MSTTATYSRAGRSLLAWRPDSRPLIEWGTAALVLIYYLRNFALRLADPDLWGRLAVGQLVAKHGTLPKTDPFAYTPTLPLWVDHEWLTGVVFYGLYQVCGDYGLLILKTLLGMGMLLFVWLTSRKNGAARLPLLVFLVIAMPVFGYGITPRAQMFTYCFFALWLLVLEHDRRGRSRWLLALLPLSIIPWANLHGGFLAGLGLLALYTLATAYNRRRCWPLAAALVACLVATLVNPYGFAYWRYLIPAVTMHRPNIPEWAPVPFSLHYAQFWLLVVVSLAGLWKLRTQSFSALAPALVIVVTMVLAIRHARHMPLFAICACGFLPGVWLRVDGAKFRRRGQPFSASDVLLLTALSGAILIQLHGLVISDGPLRLSVSETGSKVENEVMYPVSAVQFAVDHQIRGNIAVPFNWGEYAIWFLYPNCKVSMDGRYETAYPVETVEMVDRFYAGAAGWDELIDRQATNFVLAPVESPVNALLGRRGWRLLHEDQAAQLWARQ